MHGALRAEDQAERRQDDPDDNRIVECAVHSRSEAVITNDGDLLRIKSYDGIEMLKVGAFLNPVQGRGRQRSSRKSTHPEPQWQSLPLHVA
jgi:hypothetical protein